MAWARLKAPPAGSPGEVPTERLAAAMEALTAAYAAAPWAEEMARARHDFEQSRGKVYEDEPQFEAQLAGCLEWYLLERPLGDRPPVVRALRECSDEEARQALRALALSYRSLFEVVEVLRRETLLHDLIRGGLWRVQQEPALPGVDPEDIFEARLLPFRGSVAFGPLFFFHPRAARPSILRVLEALRARGPLGPEVLGTLATMRLKHDRFRNIAIDRIYSLTWRGSTTERGGEREVSE